MTPDVQDSFGSASIIGNEPESELTSFVRDDAHLNELTVAALADASAYQQKYKGHFKDLSAEDLAEAIQAYDTLATCRARIAQYGSLLKFRDRANLVQFQQIDKSLQPARDAVRFFGLELNTLPEEIFTQLAALPMMADYREWLRQLRLDKPHQLSEDAENMGAQKNRSGLNMWLEYFAQVISDMRFELNGEKLTQSEILHKWSNALTTEDALAAYNAFNTELTRHRTAFEYIYNAVMFEHEISGGMRKYPGVVSSRNASNAIEDDVVDALNTAVTQGYPQTSHRYYGLLARLLGRDGIHVYERAFNPLRADQEKIAWNDARDLIIESYREFSPELAAAGQEFFDNNWIDARVRPGKREGAFAHPMTVNTHPYLHINWLGSTRDMFTVAHELGHGVHFMLASRHLQRALPSDVPLTLAETASVFGERLVFEKAIATETDPRKRQVMLIGKIQDSIATTVRQIAMFNYELEAHKQRREKGHVSASQLGDIWVKTQGQALGPHVKMDESYKVQWSYIPHLVRTPFYVYAYAFGEALVSALYNIYEQTPTADRPAFVEKYLDLLKAGGSKHHSDALKPFGIDLRDPNFWQNGVTNLSKLIDRLEGELEAHPFKPASPKAP